MANETSNHSDESADSGRNGADQQRRLQSAIDKAASYQTGNEANAGPAHTQEPVRPMEEWRDIISQRIEDAMRLGLFDNLSGTGKPLDMHRNPFVPEDQQMAVTLLRNNDLSPEWISERKTILTAIDEMRAELRRAAGKMRSAFDSAQDNGRVDELRTTWTTWLGGWQTRMDKLNDHILVHNLKQPVRHLEIPMLMFTDEVVRSGAKLEWVQSSS